VAEIVVGKTVRLKSGGPLMTVEAVESEKIELQARCIWFDEQNQPHEAVYAFSSLVVAGG
jgi:uncharacterized protein YodC (DUF2158 family)